MSDSRIIENTQAIIDNWSGNDWGGTPPAEEFRHARYAVVVERENDSWVLPAKDECEVAATILGTYTDTTGYDEWVGYVFDLWTGEPVPFDHALTIHAHVNGVAASAS